MVPRQNAVAPSRDTISMRDNQDNKTNKRLNENTIKIFYLPPPYENPARTSATTAMKRISQIIIAREKRTIYMMGKCVLLYKRKWSGWEWRKISEERQTREVLNKWITCKYRFYLHCFKPFMHHLFIRVHEWIFPSIRRRTFIVNPKIKKCESKCFFASTTNAHTDREAEREIENTSCYIPVS